MPQNVNCLSWTVIAKAAVGGMMFSARQSLKRKHPSTGSTAYAASYSVIRLWGMNGIVASSFRQ